MILITGPSGNTGKKVVNKLIDIYGKEMLIGISRKEKTDNIGIVKDKVNLNNRKEVEKIFEGNNITSIIHIANIKFSPLIMELANKYQVPKVILVHTTGIYSKYRSYSQLYKSIESGILKNSYPNSNYTILRPTMIYGNEEDHNMHKLIKFLSKSPVFPIFGSGLSSMQPVHVEDLAEAIVKAHENPIAMNNDYDLSGGTVIEYKRILNTITRELNKKVVYIHIPIRLAITAAKFYNKLFKNALISVEQVERLQEDKAYSNEKAIREIGFTPREFEDGIKQEIKLLKEKGII
jgi:nucleoside-diphosphate-sugar epimerase